MMQELEDQQQIISFQKDENLLQQQLKSINSNEDIEMKDDSSKSIDKQVLKRKHSEAEKLLKEQEKKRATAEALLMMATTTNKEIRQISMTNNNEKISNNNYWKPPTITEYPTTISGPFNVIVQREKTTEDNKTSKLFAIDVAKHLIPKWDGKVFEEIKQSGYNKVTIITYYRKVANEVLKLDTLKNNQLKAFVPTSYIYRKCIIRNIPEDLDIENESYWKNNLELICPVSKLEIVHVQRFKKKNPNSNQPNQNEWIPTRTILVTYKGQVTPQHAYLLKVKHNVDIYLPRVRMCTNCYRYNHVSKNCKLTKKRCIHCGVSEHDEINCQKKDDPPTCLNCQGNHLPTDRNCNKRKIEQDLHDEAIKNNTTVQTIKKSHKAQETGRKKFRWSEFPHLNEDYELSEEHRITDDNIDSYNPSDTYKNKLMTQKNSYKSNKNPKNKSLNNLYDEENFDFEKYMRENDTRGQDTQDLEPIIKNRRKLALQRSRLSNQNNEENITEKNSDDKADSSSSGFDMQLSPLSIDNIQKEADEIIIKLCSQLPANYLLTKIKGFYLDQISTNTEN